MAQPYIEQIFDSYKRNFSPTRSMEQWLDGEHGWRTPLRRIGEMAREIGGIEDLRVARQEWSLRLRVYQWISSYIVAVPLLDRAATRADHDEQAFRQFMSDLATLAEI